MRRLTDKWTEEEIKKYKPIEDELLQMVYDRAGIPPDASQDRAKYLIEEVLGLSKKDQEIILERTIIIKDRAEAMSILEQIAAEFLKKHSKEIFIR